MRMPHSLRMPSSREPEFSEVLRCVLGQMLCCCLAKPGSQARNDSYPRGGNTWLSSQAGAAFLVVGRKGNAEEDFTNYQARKFSNPSRSRCCCLSWDRLW